MPKPEVKKEQVEVLEEENKDLEKNKDDGIDIPLDDNGEPKTPESIKKEQDDAKKTQEEETHKRNAEFAQRRVDQEKAKLRQQLEDSNRRIAELEKKGGQSFGFSQNNANVIKDKQYWEKRLADDPVGALDEYSDFKDQQRLQKQMEMQERQQMADSFNSTLEDSKNMAIEEFPSLKDEGSPEFVMFMEILDKNPAWRQSPIGPMKVIREMKKQLADGKGDDVISKAKSEALIAERNRQARIVNQPLGSGRPSPKDNTITLTKDQIAAANEMGVPLEKYAKILKRMQGNQEVTI